MARLAHLRQAGFFYSLSLAIRTPRFSHFSDGN